MQEIDDKNRSIQQAKERVIGCKEKCPSCGKLCDAEHWREKNHAAGDTENRHKCEFGHQFGSFIGIIIEHTQ